MEFLQTRNVVKQFSNHLALDEVNINVPENSIFGLLGPNGAGKTTLLRIINQITAPDSGEVLIEGRKMSSADTAIIGYLPEERGLYKKMKVGEQALYLAQLKGLSKIDAMKKLKFWFEKYEIVDWWHKKVEELSKGMQQKVQFITTIIHEPKLLIFDEPFSGFDPINANLLKAEILNLHEKGATIIFSTHNMASVEELCDRISLINEAKVILDGRIDEIRKTFRTNTYEISYTGDPEKIISNLPASYSMENSSESQGIYTSIIKANGDVENNKLIAQLLKSVEIQSFNEVIPSMNDVFIRVVQETNSNKS